MLVILNLHCHIHTISNYCANMSTIYSKMKGELNLQAVRQILIKFDLDL